MIRFCGILRNRRADRPFRGRHGVQKNGTELTEPQQPAELMSKYDQANADAVLIGSNTPDPRVTAELCEGWTADYAPVLRRLPVKAVSDCARLVPQIFKRIKKQNKEKNR